MPDNRELALLITVATLLTWALVYRPTRGPIGRVLRMLFWSRLTLAGTGAGLWLAGALALMAEFDLWTGYDLKTTLLWFFTAGCLLVFKGMQATNPNAEFRQIVAEQFRFVLFFELVVNTYPFSLAGELILLLGTGFLALLLAFAELNPEHAATKRLLEVLLILVLAFVVGFSIYHVCTEPEQVFSRAGLRTFGLPIYFTLVMLPYAWLLTVYAAYEVLFVMKVGDHKMMPAAVRRYAKWQLVRICGLNTNAIRRAQAFLPVEFRWANSRKMVDAELLRLREELAWDKAPPGV